MKTSFSLKALVFFVALLGLLIPVYPVYAEGPADNAVANPGSSALPTFEQFVASVKNDKAGIAVGVYVPDVLALRVVQQPAGNPGYISTAMDEVTQFGMASQYGVSGLLAHNYLSGVLFDKIAIGKEVRIVLGDGQVEYYVVSAVHRFQALSPYSPNSDFIDLSNGMKYTAADLFKLVYQGSKHVTFQTCIWDNDNPSWGRLFVIATPMLPPMLPVQITAALDVAAVSAYLLK